MILAVGLTPAWQHILVFDRLNAGHVNRAQSSMWCASGKVLNVGAALHHLGAESLTLCPVGGPTGEQIQADFARRSVPARWLNTESATRVCTTLLDQGHGITTELVENSTALSVDELQAYLDTYALLVRSADMVVFSGSLPKGTPADFYRQLLEKTSVPAVLDIRGTELTECLALRPLVVKPNREELSMTVGHPLHRDADLEDAMRDVQQRGAQWVIVSNGSQTLLALGPDGLHRIDPPPTRVVNPIGCGDSLTAAVAAKLQTGADPLSAIHFGVEYAAKKAAILYPVLMNDQ